MTSIISALIIILLILLFTIFAAWIDKFGAKHKEEFIDEAIENGHRQGFDSCYIQDSNGVGEV